MENDNITVNSYSGEKEAENSQQLKASCSSADDGYKLSLFNHFARFKKALLWFFDKRNLFLEILSL